MALDIRVATQADVAAIAAVHVASWREHYRGILADDVIASRSLENRLNHWRHALGQPERVTFVAFSPEGVLCGFASAVRLSPPKAGFTSYLETLYLRAGAKGRGAGRALLTHIARALLSRGCSNMALRTLRSNPARGFYEHLGARLLANFEHEAGNFDDVAYGFDDLLTLV